jgi:5'/3'-nucleotidase SurE
VASARSHSSIAEEVRYLCIERIGLSDPCSSWISSAYMIKDSIPVSRYSPPAEYTTSAKEPWILLGGTPATCSNIALHNLYPGQVDLVLSGPNYGRNTSSAFALSSGTVGAALTASMAGVPAIAVSYGVFERPVPPAILAKAHEIACTVISTLCEPDPSQALHIADPSAQGTLSSRMARKSTRTYITSTSP